MLGEQKLFQDEMNRVIETRPNYTRYFLLLYDAGRLYWSILMLFLKLRDKLRN